MSFGAEIRNDGGGILLDASYESIRLYAEGTIRTSNYSSLEGGIYNGFYYFPEPIASDEPFLFCIQPKNRWITARPQGEEDANGNVSFTRVAMSSDVDDVFNFKMFTRYDFGTPSIVGNHGIQIFGPSGEVIYDSRINEGLYLDSVYVPEHDPYDGISGTQSHAYAPDAYYSINLFPGGLYTWETASSTTRFWEHRVFRQGSSTSVEYGVIGGYGDPLPIKGNFPAGRMVLIDDSNF